VLYLASQSPRRRQLLYQLGVAFAVVDVHIDEQRQPGESPIDYVSRVAREKAEAGLHRLDGVAEGLVLGADTEVILGDRVFGKPANIAEATEMLSQLSNRTHQVISAVWCINSVRQAHTVSISEVTFALLSSHDIENYLATGESFGKAGGYAIQGKAAMFIRHLRGSYSGVMGLPLFETAELLKEFTSSPLAMER